MKNYYLYSRNLKQKDFLLKIFKNKRKERLCKLFSCCWGKTKGVSFKLHVNFCFSMIIEWNRCFISSSLLISSNFFTKWKKRFFIEKIFLPFNFSAIVVHLLPCNKYSCIKIRSSFSSHSVLFFQNNIFIFLCIYKRN